MPFRLLTLAAFAALLHGAAAEAPALDGNQTLLPAAQGRDLGLFSGTDAITYCSGGESGRETLSANSYYDVWSCPRAGGFPAGTKSQLTADFNYYSYQGFGWDDMAIYITDGADCSKNPTTSSTFQAYLSQPRTKTAQVTMGPTTCSSTPCCVVAVCYNSNGRACSTAWRWEVFRPIPPSSSSTPSYLPSPSATPTPSATPSDTPTATGSTGATPSPTPLPPSDTATPSVTPSETCSPSLTPSPSASSTPPGALGAPIGGGGGGSSGGAGEAASPSPGPPLLAVVGGVLGAVAVVGAAAALGAWAYFYRQQGRGGKLAAGASPVRCGGGGSSGAGAGGGAAGAAAAAAAAAAAGARAEAPRYTGATAAPYPPLAPAVMVPVRNPLHLPPAL